MLHQQNIDYYTRSLTASSRSLYEEFAQMQNRLGAVRLVVEIDRAVQREAAYLLDSKQSHGAKRPKPNGLDNNSRVTCYVIITHIGAESLTNFLCIGMVQSTSGI